MGNERTRQLCVAMIEHHTELQGAKEQRSACHKARDTARDALMAAVAEAGGALRVDATRLLRVQDVPTRRVPKPDMVGEAVARASTSQLTPDAGDDDSAAGRLADAVFQHLKPQLWPKVPRLALTTSCPRGLKRDALTPLPDALAPVLRTYEDNGAVLRKRPAPEGLDRADPQLLAQLSQAGGRLRYSLTVNGERRSATLATEPAQPCELLVKEVQAAVHAVAARVFADMDDAAVERAWLDENARARFTAALWDEMVARREQKRAAVPRRVALRRLE